MEFSVDYVEKHSLFTVVHKGDLDKQSLIASINAYTSHPKWGPDAKLISDFRECTLRDLSPPEIQEMAKVTSDLSDKIGSVQIGIIMSDQHDYGMARFWQINAEKKSSFEGKVFLKPELAMQWLVA